MEKITTIPNDTPANNSKIQGESTYRYDISDTKNYTPIITGDKNERYTFTTNAYFGEGGFYDGSYLWPHAREFAYDERRARSVYCNYFQPIVDAMYKPVYTSKIVRKVMDGEQEKLEGTYATEFINDCDNNGNSLHELSEDATMYGIMNGIVFAVVENFPPELLAPTEGENIRNRTLPYTYLKKAEQLECWESDDWGNLKSIRFFDEIITEKNESGKEEQYKYYSEWNDEYKLIIRVDTAGKETVVSEVLHGLDEMPVITYMYGKKMKRTDYRVSPPLYQIAKIGLGILNKDSVIDQTERDQGFSLLTLQDDTRGDLSLGSKNVLYYPTEAKNAPGFIAPDPDLLIALTANSDRYREIMFAIARQHGIIAIEKKESGVAKAYDFHTEDKVLQGVAKKRRAFESAIMRLVSLYTKEPYVFVTTDNESYSPVDTKATIENIETALLSQYPPIAEAVLKEIQFDLIVGEDDSEQIQKAKEQIREMEIVNDSTKTKDEDDDGSK